MSETNKTAVIHRLVLPEHTCPFGARARDLLQEQGYEVEDHHLTTRSENDDFKKEHRVRTTPLIFIGDDRFDGLDELEVYFDLAPDERAT